MNAATMGKHHECSIFPDIQTDLGHVAHFPIFSKEELEEAITSQHKRAPGLMGPPSKMMKVVYRHIL